MTTDSASSYKERRRNLQQVPASFCALRNKDLQIDPDAFIADACIGQIPIKMLRILVRRDEPDERICTAFFQFCAQGLHEPLRCALVAVAFEYADPVEVSFCGAVKARADHGGIDTANDAVLLIGKKRKRALKSRIIKTARDIRNVFFIDLPASEIFLQPQFLLKCEHIGNAFFCIRLNGQHGMLLPIFRSFCRNGDNR